MATVSKIAQLRKELSKLKPSNYDVLSSSCEIWYDAREKEYLIIAPNKNVIDRCYFYTLLEKIQEALRLEQHLETLD